MPEELGNQDQQTDREGKMRISCPDGWSGYLHFGPLVGTLSVFLHSWPEEHVFNMNSHLKSELEEKKVGEN